MNHLIFLIGCLSIRTSLALFAKWLEPKNQKHFAIISVIVGIAFITLYLGDLRKTGREAGGLIWWNKLRPVHGLLYLLFAIYSFKEEPFAWKILLVDVFVGLIAWIARYKFGLIFA